MGNETRQPPLQTAERYVRAMARVLVQHGRAGELAHGPGVVAVALDEGGRVRRAPVYRRMDELPAPPEVRPRPDTVIISIEVLDAGDVPLAHGVFTITGAGRRFPPPDPAHLGDWVIVALEQVGRWVATFGPGVIALTLDGEGHPLRYLVKSEVRRLLTPRGAAALDALDTARECLILIDGRTDMNGLWRVPLATPDRVERVD